MIQNVSWNADREQCLSLLPTVNPLALAAVEVSRRLMISSNNFSDSHSSTSSSVSDDKILRAIYSALWNMALGSSKCREEMCIADQFLDRLVSWFAKFTPQMIFAEPMVGLAKCLVGE